MALIKSKELSNGLSGEYWVAEPRIDMVNKNTNVIMLLFKDKEARDSGKKFILRERVDDIDGIYLTGEQVYAQVKTSNLIVVTPAQDAVLDDSGEVVSPAVQEVTEETNWFADAEDC